LITSPYFLEGFFSMIITTLKVLHVKQKGHVQTLQGNNRKNNSNQPPVTLILLEVFPLSTRFFRITISHGSEPIGFHRSGSTSDIIFVRSGGETSKGFSPYLTGLYSVHTLKFLFWINLMLVILPRLNLFAGCDNVIGRGYPLEIIKPWFEPLAKEDKNMSFNSK
jgi:hypothetical protein